MPLGLDDRPVPLSADASSARQRLRDRLPFSRLSAWRRKPADEATVPLDSTAAPPRQWPVVAAQPRQLAIQRQESERRDRLEALDLTHVEKRAHRRAQSAVRSKPSRPRLLRRRSSAPDMSASSPAFDHGPDSVLLRDQLDATSEWLDTQPPPLDYEDQRSESDAYSDGSADDTDLRKELESRWILNLSMTFRDKSDREKFFLTYAQQPNRWRRITVSCDYRHAQPDSLEADLKSLHYQKDKSARIYESIRDSLPDIRFFDTVTNLELATREGRLHVHVTEDANEIICYPPVATVNHEALRDLRRVTESEISFDGHLSGFVYKVRLGSQLYIKKEIPAPDMIDEFLYELNALASLRGEANVIQLEAIILDDKRQTVRGLLLHYAHTGALVDVIYDQADEPKFRAWARREKWARQIVNGLCAIHEKGFVQGDFTLSNIVIDGDDNARVIDINRRGCPMGWEPPEFKPIICSGSRISMFIGVKSDLYQLGMVLWALSMREENPEQAEILDFEEPGGDDVPRWFQNIVNTCLHRDPAQRVAAKRLLRQFPRGNEVVHLNADEVVSLDETSDTVLDMDAAYPRSKPEYIDPENAVERWDIERHFPVGDLGRPPTDNGSRNHPLDSGASQTPSTAPTEFTNHLEMLQLPTGNKDASRKSSAECLAHQREAIRPPAPPAVAVSAKANTIPDQPALRVDTGSGTKSATGTTSTAHQRQPSFAHRMQATLPNLRESPQSASPSDDVLAGIGGGLGAELRTHSASLVEEWHKFGLPQHQDSGYGDDLDQFMHSSHATHFAPPQSTDIPPLLWPAEQHRASSTVDERA